ncbi:MAG: hypothetical protein ACP6IY_08020, partial [Promethearchaeia archaeon]
MKVNVAGNSIKIPLLVLSNLKINWIFFNENQLDSMNSEKFKSLFSDLDILILSAHKYPLNFEKQVINFMKKGLNLLILGGWGQFDEFDFGKSLIYKEILSDKIKIFSEPTINKITEINFDTDIA